MPGFRDRLSRTEIFTLSESPTEIQVARATARHGASMTKGLLAPPLPPPTGIITIDGQPGDTSSTAAILVDGAHIVSTIDTIGDQDFFRVELVAGQSYQIGMYAKYGGPNGVPLADSYVEVYGPAGTLLAFGDGGATTDHNLLFSGFDALFTFTAAATGTYFINARAYDDGVSGDNKGNYVGDYELFIETPPPPPPPPPPEPNAQSLFPTTVDNVPNNSSSTVAIAANGAAVVSTIDAPGDKDFFKIELQAGHAYSINQSAFAGGPSGIALADSYLELYDSAGNLIAFSNSGGDMPGGLVTTTVNARLDFYAEQGGTYYINARSGEVFTGSGGDHVGDYQLKVEGWDPYYTPDDPLYSIDWGTQVDGSSRNPDGEEGPRVTGNPETGYAWNPYGIEGKTVITYYFAKQGEVFVDEDLTTAGTTDTIVANGFSAWEKNAYTYAFNEYAKVADIVYVEVQDKTDADFIMITYEGTPGPGVSLLGQMNPPGEENEGHSMFNAGDERWTEQGLAPGGFSFTTLIHEMGHGHGLAHPHDNGGHSGIMNGVEEESAFNYTNGAFDLNQSVYTMMSYEDGWEKSPYGQPDSGDPYGWLGSLMAFDIAAIQDKYGVNADTATGDDTYVLKDENAPGTFYSCIWDCGGTDGIVYGGARDANIDLRAASLQYEYGGGGWISYAYGIFGGFTIANGVTIENATGGSGNDTLIGNAAANVLSGGGGTDSLSGMGGNDTYIVGDAGDQVLEAAGNGYDVVYSAVSYALSDGSEVEGLSTLDWAAMAAIDLTGNAIANYMIGNAGANQLNGGGGADLMHGREGNDTYLVDNAGDVAIESSGQGYDVVYTSTSYALADAYEVEGLSTFDWSGTAAIDLTGNALYNYLIGNAGANVLNGRGGSDVLYGKAGADTFAFTDALGGANVDYIGDFSTADDTIALDDAVFAALGATFEAGELRIGLSAADADDRIIYDPVTGGLFYDADGVGLGAAVQFAQLSAGLDLTTSDFAMI